jgi:glycogen operon protein
VKWNEAVFSYHFNDPDGSANAFESAPFMPKSGVVSPYFDRGSDRHPNTPAMV